MSIVTNNPPDSVAHLKKSLSVVSDQLPLAALREAVTQRETLTPMLLAALAAMQIRSKGSNSPAQSRLALHALFLLTEFREPSAWPVVLDLFSSMSSAENIAIGDDFDEVVCDQLSQILATLCPGDITPLQAIIENPAIDEYVRDAALGALVVRYHQGDLELEPLQAYLHQLYQGDLELEPLQAYLHQLYQGGLEQEKNQVWNAWVQACYNTDPEPFMAALTDIYDRELADTYYITLEELSLRCGLDPEVIKRSVQKQEGEFYCYLDDAVKALGQLSCYSGASNELLTTMENLVINQTAPKVNNERLLSFNSDAVGVGRNDACPCGSGKKFKKCCLH